MIIEIKGIPNQKIKRINFDIEFDDGNINQNISDIDNINTNNNILSKTCEVNLPPKEFKNETTLIIEDISERKPKEVPAEMLDAEF